MSGFTALVLAGSRGGPDPVADYAAAPHKALIVLEGMTLLERVARALAAAGAGRICVSCSHPAVAAEAARLDVGVAVETAAAAAGPSQSVLDAARRLGAPLLVATADHALLQADWVRRFLADCPADADIAALLAPEAAVRAAAPQGRRTYLRFRDGRYCGCNLFLLRTPDGLKAIELWRRVEAHRKQPLRIAWTLGPAMLPAGLGLLTLDDAVGRLGRRAGVRARAVRTPFGLAAVDVDKPEDLDLARRLARGEASGPM